MSNYRWCGCAFIFGRKMRYELLQGYYLLLRYGLHSVKLSEYYPDPNKKRARQFREGVQLFFGYTRDLIFLKYWFSKSSALAHWASTAVTISLCPFLAVTYKAVGPSILGMSGSTPAFNRKVTVSRLPAAAYRCRDLASASILRNLSNLFAESSAEGFFCA